MRFRGEYAFLSNFYPCVIEVKGFVFPSVENAYMAGKCKDLSLWPRFVTCTPAEAKRLARRIQLRAGWNELRVPYMRALLRRKFEHAHLADRLLATGDIELIEENWWGDTFWGVCNGQGQNMLGKLLMERRASLR